jgi:hypothetical protein
MYDQGRELCDGADGSEGDVSGGGDGREGEVRVEVLVTAAVVMKMKKELVTETRT